MKRFVLQNNKIARKQSWFFIIRSFVLFSIAFFVSACGTKLIDINKTSSFLDLSKEQSQVIQPKIEKIKTILDEYNKEKKEFETELKKLRSYGMSGDRGKSGLREELEAFRKTRSEYQGKIDTLVAEIKAIFDEEQLKKFEEIEQPKLKMPEFGGGQRPGGGRRGDGGRGRRGGGFPPF